MDVERIDLATIAEMLERLLAGHPAEGYIRGRTVLRDAIAAHLGCSELEAEELVDTMVGRGFLAFSGQATEAAGIGAWSVRPR